MRLFTTLASALVASVLTSVTLLSSPAAAADLWGDDCQRDLSQTLWDARFRFEETCEKKCGFDETIPRFIATQYAGCIDELISVSEKGRWRGDKTFRRPYLDELQRMQNWLQNDLGKIHELARLYKARNRDPMDQSLALLLLNWGVEKKHPPAEFENLQQNFLDRSSSYYAQEMTRLSEEGYIPAMKDLARRYFHGDVFEQDKGSAWYWLKRLQQEGVDTSSITTTSLEQLLKVMKLQERRTLAYWAYYYDDLNLSGIKIPAAFAPLSTAMPPPLSEQEIAQFRERYKGVNRALQLDAYWEVEGDLVARTVGIERWQLLSIHGQIRPLGMGNEEFAQRKCTYQRAVSAIFSEGRNWEGDKVGLKDLALSSLFEGVSSRAVKDSLACTTSHTNRESENVRQALAWAKEISILPPSSLRALAKSYRQKRDAGPEFDGFEGKSEAELRAMAERAKYGQLARTLENFADHKAEKI